MRLKTGKWEIRTQKTIIYSYKEIDDLEKKLQDQWFKRGLR